MKTLLRLAGVTKRFGGTDVLGGIDLEVLEGELVSVLGPSGCGKTTLLRIVAGFERPTAGRVELDGRDIALTPPHRRSVNTVFQRYLLFPHLTVFENVAFGLRVSGVPRREIEPRVHEALDLVRLRDLAGRRSDQLSGGQSQRVSLARALVNRPKLLLLDEPLSALDLKVRMDMQAELRRIHRETGTTFLYVTHDQQEAMSLSDRVVVMNKGHIEQVGAPTDVYHAPCTAFVAQFVGDANLLPVEAVSRNGGAMRLRLRAGSQELDVHGDTEIRDGWLVLRPEILCLAREGQGLVGTVADVAFLGSSVAYHVDVDGTRVRVHEAGAHLEPSYAIGDRVTVIHDPARCVVVADVAAAA